MPQYPITYIETHCIDIYFRFNNTPIHLLTRGNEIPDALNDIIVNRQLQHIVAKASDFRARYDAAVAAVIVNNRYVDRMHQEYENYIHTFPESESIMPSVDDYLRMHLPNALLGFHSYVFYRDQGSRYQYEKVVSPLEGNVLEPQLFWQLPEYNEVEMIDDYLFYTINNE